MDRLLGKFRVNARAAEKEQTLHARVVRKSDEIILDLQIVQEKLDREIVVRLDAADFSGSDDDGLRLRFLIELLDRRRVSQIQLGSSFRDQIRIASRGEFAHDGAPD